MVWLFSAPVDLTVFLGSAVLAFVLLGVGSALGVLHEDTPGWAWIFGILLVDVAHVWSTGFRVYFDREEMGRRPFLYLGVPIVGYLLGVALYSEGRLVFWRALAYLAVFHFVRQQYGWVALYRARAGDTARLGRWIDISAIYLATIYPLVYWHTHLPLRFRWFVRDDFAPLPGLLEQILAPIFWLSLGLYLARMAWLWLVRRAPNPGKDIVVLTTALCWYVGIVAFNSDYAFTMTNVLIHGIPYLALVYWYRWVRPVTRPATATTHLLRLTGFLATVWLLAYVEELFWDRTIWHEHGWLFGESWSVGTGWQVLLVPLLALPQITHYTLDGFLWKRRANPEFTLVAPGTGGG